MDFKTSISTVKNGRTVVRGENLNDLAEKHSFVANVYFILTGKKASAEIEKMLDIIFSLSLDHGFGAVSTLAARVATSSKVNLQQSLIAALAAMGHAHGGATEDAAVWLADRVAAGTTAAAAAADALKNKKIIPGYGHSIMGADERSDLMIKKAKELGVAGKHAQLALDVEQEIKNQKGKSIPLNVDGAIAAIALDLGLPSHSATGLFIIGRIPGLLAHIKEEIEQQNGLRRLREEEIDYQG